MQKIEVGSVAPDFTAKDQDGNEVILSGLKGKKVVLYFYPKDNTPGCTAQACSLRDGKSELEKLGFTIIGVSPDTGKSHKGFIDKQKLNFTLISDEDKTVAQLYGVWGLKKFMGREYMGIVRTTFIIDANGVIEKVIEKVDTKRHFEQIVDLYK